MYPLYGTKVPQTLACLLVYYASSLLLSFLFWTVFSCSIKASISSRSSFVSYFCALSLIRRDSCYATIWFYSCCCAYFNSLSSILNSMPLFISKSSSISLVVLSTVLAAVYIPTSAFVISFVSFRYRPARLTRMSLKEAWASSSGLLLLNGHSLTNEHLEQAVSSLECVNFLKSLELFICAMFTRSLKFIDEFSGLDSTKQGYTARNCSSAFGNL